MFKVPEQFRMKTGGQMATTILDGNNGVFMIPIVKKMHNRKGETTKYYCHCVATEGQNWDNVIVVIYNEKGERVLRYPTRNEMVVIKNYFWAPEDAVLEYHHNIEYLLFDIQYAGMLWRPKFSLIPLPPKDFKGFTGKPQMKIEK